VLRALEDAERLGHVGIQRGFRVRGHRANNVYRPIIRSRVAHAMTPGWCRHDTRVAHTDAPEPLTEPLIEPLIQTAPQSARASRRAYTKEAPPSAEERGCPSNGELGNPGEPLSHIAGGETALDALLGNGQAMSLGGLSNYVAAHGEELDRAAFIASGAVYREGKYVFPVGCKRIGNRDFEMPEV
jgi:hypothetical protein